MLHMFNLFQVPESQANCLVDAFLTQLRKKYFIPLELDALAIRNNTMAFFLQNFEQYEVSVHFTTPATAFNNNVIPNIFISF